jgi:hypothetical protein
MCRCSCRHGHTQPTGAVDMLVVLSSIRNKRGAKNSSQISVTDISKRFANDGSTINAKDFSV